MSLNGLAQGLRHKYSQLEVVFRGYHMLNGWIFWAGAFHQPGNHGIGFGHGFIDHLLWHIRRPFDSGGVSHDELIVIGLFVSVSIDTGWNSLRWN